MTIYSTHDLLEGGMHVARSKLGKYANSLGPVTLPKGKYKLVVHPDLDSTTME
jgi:hypothetical protein